MDDKKVMKLDGPDDEAIQAFYQYCEELGITDEKADAEEIDDK